MTPGAGRWATVGPNPPLARPGRPLMTWLVVLAVATACSPRDDPSAPAPGTSRGPAPSEADVVRIVDGDTIRVLVDGVEEKVRLIGIDTPEVGECLADRATARLTELIGDGPVHLAPDVSDRDRYGRLLRYVEVDGTFVNAVLVAEGLAISRPFAPDTARQDELDAAQDQARRAGRGLWASDACGTPSSAGPTALEVSRIHENPPGDDTRVLNEEWIEILNTGTSPIDLTGWSVKDESASKRFAFPDGFTLSRGARVRIHSGCGDPTPTDLYWCQSGSAVWNNSGDTVFVLDPDGNIAVWRSY